jgi:acetyl-CoA carboxylase carboxyl transferase subunit alpha
VAVADQVAVMEHAYYSVISPEGCAAILWKSGAQASLAADALKLTPEHLRRLNLIDAIVPEPLGGAHRNPEDAARSLESWIGKALRDVRRVKIDTLLRRRYERLRKLGSFFESAEQREQTVARPRTKRARPATGVAR